MAYISGTKYNDNGSSMWTTEGTYEYFPELLGTFENDTIYGLDGFDTLRGFEGRDSLYGGNLEDYLYGGNGNDYLDGGNDDDLLVGESGNDILRGWNGGDTMIGGTGNDTYFIETIGDGSNEWQHDYADEKYREGIDTVNSKLIDYKLSLNVENLNLIGTAKINGAGNSLNNVITGNSAINQLNGAAGNDTLDGKGSSDKLTGGTGKDIFKFTTKGSSDQITDYNVANDTIQLENAVFTKLTTGTLAASQFKVGARAADANDFIIYNKPTGALLYDADGNGGGAATRIADVNDGLNLTNADIFVI